MAPQPRVAPFWTKKFISKLTSTGCPQILALGPSSSFKASSVPSSNPSLCFHHHITFSLSLNLALFFESCDYTGPNWIIKNYNLTLKLFSSSYLQSSFLQASYSFRMFWGLGCGYPRETIKSTTHGLIFMNNHQSSGNLKVAGPSHAYTKSKRKWLQILGIQWWGQKYNRTP